MATQVITDGVIKFFQGKEANINSAHEFLVAHDGNGVYRKGDIDAGDYTFSIASAGRGTVVGHITLPDPNDLEAVVKEIPPIEMVPGRAVQDINLVDKDGADVAIASGRLLVSRIDATSAAPGAWTVANVPIGTSRLIEFKPTGAAAASLQNMKLLRPIEATGDALNLVVYPPFVIKVDLYRGTAASNVLDNSNARVWVQKPYETEWTEIQRTSNSSYFILNAIDGFYKLRGLANGATTGYEISVSVGYTNTVSTGGVYTRRIDLFGQQGQTSFSASEMI